VVPGDFRKRFQWVVAVMTLSGLSACSALPSLRSARTGENGTAYVAVFAYPSQPGTTLARIDTNSDRTEASLRTTVSEPAALAEQPGTGSLLVVGTGDDQLVVLDRSTGHVQHRIVVGLQPDALAITPRGGQAIVADSGSGKVTVVNLRSDRVRRSLDVGAVPDAIAVGGSRLDVAVVADEGESAVVIVTLPSLHVGAPIAVGSEPDAVAIAPGGAIALVADFGSNSVTPVSLPSGIAGRPISLGFAPTGLAVSQDPAPGMDSADDPAGTAWVTGGRSLAPIDLSTMTLGAAIDVGRPAEAVALSNGGRQAWVADQNSRVTTVDLADGRVGATTYVGGRPSAIIVAGP